MCIAIPAATATFSDSFVPVWTISTISSQQSICIFESPSTSFPTTMAHGNEAAYEARSRAPCVRSRPMRRTPSVFKRSKHSMGSAAFSHSTVFSAPSAVFLTMTCSGVAEYPASHTLLMPNASAERNNDPTFSAERMLTATRSMRFMQGIFNHVTASLAKHTGSGFGKAIMLAIRAPACRGDLAGRPYICTPRFRTPKPESRNPANAKAGTPRTGMPT
jgi:hypothetical protein